MTSRRKLFQYAQTSAQQPSHQAGLSPAGGRPGSSSRPGPGPRGSSFQPAPGGGVILPHPAPGARIHPGEFHGEGFDPGGVGSGGPTNPMLRLLYPEAHSEQGDIVNSPHCYLPNNDPNAEPMVDRGRPLSTYDKSVRLGFQPQPRTLGFVPRGDAATGDTIFRRTQLFARMDDPVNLSVAGVPFSQSIGLATQRSSDNRPRLWHVSVFGVGRYRFSNAAQAPLSDTEIIGDGFIGATGAGLGSSAIPYVPRITNFKARAMIHDESGQRFYDFDVIGTRSFDVFAYAVTIFLLVPEGGYEVNPQSPTSNATFTNLVQDSIVGARVVPVSFETPFRPNQRTETINITSAGGGTQTQIPIPPGARKVQVINHGRTVPSADYFIDFDAGAPLGSAAVSTLGVIITDPVTFRTTPIEIPNATAIRWTEGAAAASTAFSLIYEVDP